LLLWHSALVPAKAAGCGVARSAGSTGESAHVMRRALESIVKFGLTLFGVRPTEYADVAPRAEAVGFESIWMPEHLAFPAEMPATYPYSENGVPPAYPGSPLYDPWVTLSFMAASTRRIRLGTYVYILPLRHPLVTARAFTTLDVLSAGRAILGAGVGWLADEFDFVGESFETRGRRSDEIIGLLRKLWSEKVVQHAGPFYQFGPLRFEPKPVQKPHPPIEIGGTSDPAVRRAGQLGDGWLATGALELDELAARIEEIAAIRRDAGRAELPFEISMGNRLQLDLDSVQRYADVGVTRLMLSPPLPSDGRFTLTYLTDFIDRCGDEIISKSGSCPERGES
jgi:probable F420-dependent oxidoreductase